MPRVAARTAERTSAPARPIYHEGIAGHFMRHANAWAKGNLRPRDVDSFARARTLDKVGGAVAIRGDPWGFGAYLGALPILSQDRDEKFTLREVIRASAPLNIACLEHGKEQNR